MAYTQKTLDFLQEIRLRNSRDWYREHKEDYRKYVLEPTQDLVVQLTPWMLEIDDLLITEPRVDRTISRIYRDTRFSKDKSLYRDNLWLVFARDKKLYNGLPAFFFEINPQQFTYGMGYYQAATQTMNILREMILAEDPLAQKALSAYKKQHLFQIEGDCYKRTRHRDQPEPLKEWLDRKTISFITVNHDLSLLLSDSLADLIMRGFDQLTPIYRFFCAVEKKRNAEETPKRQLQYLDNSNQK